MNTFKRKSWSIAIIIGFCALLGGCGLFETKDAGPGAAIEGLAVSGPTPAQSFLSECARQVGAIAQAATGDAASKVAAMGALERICGGQAQLMHAAAAAPAQPVSVVGALWTGVIQAADIFLRGYGIKMQRDVALVQSNNQAATTIASYGAFQGMGGSIERAGVAGYRYVQAPGAVTTNTLSGTGVLGSGTYTGPVSTTTTTTTTRTCSTGTAGAGGGTTTGAAGGASGGANC